ncbi:hypothetical protein [Streptomyces sp. NBC_00996]|uniref:hypothetical protein n=1 Tax=Streptomyces sp. NBC_00996 TaxID=2903710 RepID=UPI00386FF793|nr:hypothetical protein OG390_00325 [Streptomyces sp. NBC_00996]
MAADIVHPADIDGARPVTVGGGILGATYRVEDIAEFPRRAGLVDVDVERATSSPGAAEARGYGLPARATTRNPPCSDQFSEWQLRDTTAFAECRITCGAKIRE